MKHTWYLLVVALPAVCAILMFATAVLSPIRAWAAPILRIGDRGDPVAELQGRLVDLGYSPGPIDGIFGPMTDNAVRSFQKAMGLWPDGICGPLTWAALDRAAASASRGLFPRDRSLVGKTITVDAGHGGPEPGAISPWGDKEKAFTLGIALKVQRYLEALGATVIMTRYGDYSPGSDWGRQVDELAARTSLANTNKADLFVSIHINSYAQDTRVSGVMGFYRANSASSKVLAQALAGAVSQSTGLRLIDVQVGPYYVLNHTYMPAALLEVGFMTNWADVSALRQDAFKDAAARGIVAGILDYFSRQGHT